MPVVTVPTNISNISDRLRDIKSDIKNRIDIRPKLQNASRRWHGAYEALSVGSPYQVQEFYKYIKVYEQTPAHDLIFMNMTAQLARASLFPTNRMFKQMFKLEKHIDEMIRVKGYQGSVCGSHGMAILASNNRKLIDSYTGYKRRIIRKGTEKNMRKAQKDAKVLAVVKEARLQAKKDEEVLRCAKIQSSQAPIQKAPVPLVHAPIRLESLALNPAAPAPVPVPVAVAPMPPAPEPLVTGVPTPPSKFENGRWEYSGPIPRVKTPAPIPDVTAEEVRVRAEAEAELKALAPKELEEKVLPPIKKVFEKDEVAAQLNEVIQQLILVQKEEEEGVKDEEEEEEDSEDDSEDEETEEEVATAPDSDDEEMEKISEHDVDALEYEML